MTRRPSHLTPTNAATWQHPDAVAAYVHRAPYPGALFERLALEADGGAVLDLGCGTGALTRPLAPLVGRVDAIDISSVMLAEGQRLPGGDHPAIRWVEGAAEVAPLDGTYRLVVAGAALHWMDWGIVLPRLAEALVEGARLAIVEMAVGRETPWRAQENELLPAYSVMQDFEVYDLAKLLDDLGLWTVDERATFGPVPFEQSIEDYIEQFHSTSGFHRPGMGEARAAEFDAHIRALVEPHLADGRVVQEVVATVYFGTPRRPAGAMG